MSDVVDHRLIAAFVARRETRAEFDRDADTAHSIWQTSSIEALMDGAYEGDLTLAELLAHGDLGIGTVQHLDGELVIIDGRAYTATADRGVHALDPATLTPFAVVSRFRPGPPVSLVGPLAMGELTARIDALAPAGEPIVAVRIDGRFADLQLRSVARQEPPFRPLAEVVANQTAWNIAEATGSLVGFRFPDEAQGLEVAGYHLHFIDDNRRMGGHVIGVTVLDGQLFVDGAHELHLEVPVGVRVGGADTSERTAAAIRAVEGRPTSS